MIRSVRIVGRSKTRGIGISKDYIDHIFEPFSQEKTDARSVYQGTGLGMSIVKGLVEQMHGEIKVTSEKGMDLPL